MMNSSLSKTVKIMIPNKMDYELAINILLRDKLSDKHYVVTDLHVLLIDKEQYRLLSECGIRMRKV